MTSGDEQQRSRADLAPAATTIHARFREQVRRAPDATALRYRRETVSYAQLDVESDAVAAELSAQDVGPGSVVPVVLSRGPLFVAVLLGIVKTGAAYSALDPAWPRARLEAVVAQLAPRLLVSEGVSVGTAQSWDPAPTLIAARQEALEPPTDVAAGADACAVFFTSGTTGQPRGAVVPHAGTVELFRDCEFATLGPGAVMLQAAALPWDMLSLELWGMLTTGGTCHLLDAPTVTGRGVRTAIVSGVTLLFLTSSLFNLLVDEDPTCFAGVGQVIVGGERLSPPHVERFLSSQPTTRLTNLYGPVEATVLITTHDISPGQSSGRWGVPIGHAAPGLALKVLHDGTEAADGVVGELNVAGPRLALGYLGLPDHPAFRVLELDGRRQRWYATGDLVVRQDGLLYFAGRRDRQLKIRGHRVEPAEIEATINAVAGVASCRVVPILGDQGVDGMAAFWTAARNGGADLDSRVRRQIVTELPAYSQPGVVAEVDGFPVTANGKLDEQALLDSITSRRSTSAAVPDGPFAEAVHQEVRDVLGVASVPDGCTLTEMGASSLDRARLAMRLERRFGGMVRVVDLDEATDIGDLVVRLGGRADARPVSPDPPADGTADPAVDLSPLQSSMAYLSAQQPRDTSVLCPMLWILRPGPGPVPGSTVVRAALQDVQDRHEALRSRYLAGERAVAVPLSAQDAPAVELLELDLDGVLEQRLVDEVAAEPLDLPGARVWRAAVATSEGSTETLLATVVHHIAWDGWSEAVFARDLGKALAARIAGTVPRWPSSAPTLAALARERAVRGRYQHDPAQDRDWADHLMDAPTLDLGGSAACEDPCSPGAHIHRESVAEGALEPWRTLSTSVGCSLFTVFVAVLDEALRPFLGRPGVVAATATSTRDGAVEEHALGCIVDVRCLRLPASPPGAGWTRRVRAADEEVRLMQSHATTPFTELVAQAPVPADGRTPLFQMMFNWQDNAEADLRVTGCDVQQVRVFPPRAETELVVSLWPTPADGVDIVVTNQCDRVSDDQAGLVARRLAQLITAGTG